MPDAHWSLFVVASLAVVLIPGQDMLLVLSRALAAGTRAGLAAAAGISTGLLGHTALAALGLGAVLAASEWSFIALKLAGAAYLVVLGVQMLRARAVDVVPTPAAAGGRSLARAFRDGAASNLGNPKVAMFYFAFMPQFVAPGARSPALVLVALGLAYALLGLLVKAAVALAAGRLSGWLRTRPAALLWLHRAGGVVMLGLAARLALARRD